MLPYGSHKCSCYSVICHCKATVFKSWSHCGAVMALCWREITTCWISSPPTYSDILVITRWTLPGWVSVHTSLTLSSVCLYLFVWVIVQWPLVNHLKYVNTVIFILFEINVLLRWSNSMESEAESSFLRVNYCTLVTAKCLLFLSIFIH